MITGSRSETTTVPAGSEVRFPSQPGSGWRALTASIRAAAPAASTTYSLRLEPTPDPSVSDGGVRCRERRDQPVGEYGGCQLGLGLRLRVGFGGVGAGRGEEVRGAGVRGGVGLAGRDT